MRETSYNAPMQKGQAARLKSKIFQELQHRQVSVAIFVSVGLAFFFLAIGRVYLESSANLLARDFVAQNRIEISSADVVLLSSRLNSLTVVPEISCLTGRLNGTSFYHFGSGSCGSNFFKTSIRWRSQESGIELEFVVGIPVLMATILTLFYLILLAALFLIMKIYSAFLLEKTSRQRELSELAGQVAHDIRSPLSALNLISSELLTMNDEKRVLIRNATQRINDIANELLRYGKGKEICGSDASESEHDLVLIFTIVDSLLSEKRTQYRHRYDLDFQLELGDIYGVFVKLRVSDFQRALSNIINNSVEAISTSVRGKIRIKLKREDDFVSVEIFDNGKGIDPKKFSLIGQRGYSQGKGNESGFGLGLYQVKKAVADSGGLFEIESQTIKPAGTVVKLKFPIVEPPPWFLKQLVFKVDTKIVIVDDDKAVHDLWSNRILDVLGSGYENNLLHFTSPSQFTDWWNDTPDRSDCYCLIDYEFGNSPENGIELERRLQLGERFVLVTSRSEEKAILKIALENKVKVLPKSMIGVIPILPFSQPELNSLKNDECNNNTERIDLNGGDLDKAQLLAIKYDLCLIDDDVELIHQIWGTIARDRGLNILMFATAKDFLKNSNLIDRRTPIFIDVNLGDNNMGMDLAHELHRIGFLDLSLATGYLASELQVPNFIKKVVGKDFPDEM